MAKWVIIGLGNPGNEYNNSRHNVGRDTVRALAERFGAEFKEHSASESLLAKGEIKGTVVEFVLPETFMNKSGKSAAKFVKSAKAAERLLVIHDDLDLPFGTWKFAFDRGSGGHKGVESVMRAVKTKAFVRIKVGVSPKAFLTGKLKKPKGEDEVVKFVLGKFSPGEQKDLAGTAKTIGDAAEILVADGLEIAMNEYNRKK